MRLQKFVVHNIFSSLNSFSAFFLSLFYHCTVSLFQLISMEVVDHLRMRHTFALPYQLNPLSVQLFGDIFEEGRTDEPYLM